MQLKENFHYEELKKDAVLVRVQDVEPFSRQSTLSWEMPEPTDAVVKELFEARLNLMGGAKKEFLKLHAFRVLSKAKVQTGNFCAFWMAKIQYLQDFFMPELNLTIKENQFLLLHGRFTFWRVGNVWKAKIC